MQSSDPRPSIVVRSPAAVLGPILMLVACQATSSPTVRATALPRSEARFAISPASPAPSLQEVDETSAEQQTDPPAEPRGEPSLASPIEPQSEPPPPTAPHPDLVYSPNLYRRWGINLGGAAFHNFDTHVRISTPVLLGASLDLEDTLGVTKSSSVVRLDAFYNFNRHHGVEFSYYDIRRSGRKTIDEQIEIGDRVFGPGTIDTKFNTGIYKLDYKYSFVADYRTTIAASVGLHLMRIDTAFRTGEGINIEESFKANAPVPLIGLHASYALSPKWRLASHIEFLQLSLGPFSGGMRDTRLSLDHDTFEHFGWGIGYNGFSLDATIKGDNGLRADIGYSYSGLMLYARAYW